MSTCRRGQRVSRSCFGFPAVQYDVNGLTAAVTWRAAFPTSYRPLD